jgi:hypothetical protein
MCKREVTSPIFLVILAQLNTFVGDNNSLPVALGSSATSSQATSSTQWPNFPPESVSLLPHFLRVRAKTKMTWIWHEGSFFGVPKCGAILALFEQTKIALGLMLV